MDSWDNHVIYFPEPACAWNQGCLLGNGFMGQVVYGDLERERIDLSEITFFSGSDTVEPYRENADKVFMEMRQKAAAGDFSAVSELAESFMGIRGNYGTNLPAGSLLIEFEDHGPVSDYMRKLNLMEGVAAIHYKTPKGRGRREAFTSHEDKVFAYLLEDDSPEGMTFRLSYEGGGKPHRAYAADGRYYFLTQALEQIHSDGTEGVKLLGTVHVSTFDGECTCTDSGIQVRNSHKSVIYLAMETDYCLDRKKKNLTEEAIYSRVSYTQEDYCRLRAGHAKDISSRMKRQCLTLGGEDRKGYLRQPTAGELIENARAGKDNRQLTELMYQYGRYLLLSSSREDSPLPAPLQGVWNDDVACRIGWTCDMHLDINTQMNYWISEAGGLGECHEPLLRWMEGRLIPLGRKTARQCYGLGGWVGELVSNAWGYAAPYWHKSLSPCPTGGIWTASDFMEHYRFGQDRSFLRERAYPVIKEALEFFLPYLFEEGSGYLVGGPSISPENAFLVNGEKQYASNGCTYEVLMIRELLLEFLEAYEELEEAAAEKADCELAAAAKAALGKLPPYRILEDGTLAEWAHDYPSADLQHRHTSHLLGLFPYGQITPGTTGELAEAAYKSIRAKLTPYENWEDTGWARSMLLLYCARLEKGEEAYAHLRSMQEKLTGSNLLVMHPPTRGAGSFCDVYELDGNTGFSMGVMEMLVQSHNKVISLLPALPKDWPDGRLEGAALRGGLTLNLEWREGRLLQAEAVSDRGGRAVFAYGERTKEYVLEAKKKVIIKL